VQLGAAGGGEGSVWVGADDSPALPGFAPPPAERQRALDLVQQYRALKEPLKEPTEPCGVTAGAARPMVYSRQQPSGELLELFRSSADPVIMDKEAAGSGGCSSTFHGRLGAGVTISIDAVPAVFNSGLIKQHPICSKLFTDGAGAQGNSSRGTAAATAALSAKAVQKVYERFETAGDDLDSGLFDLADQHCYCCMQFFCGAGGASLEGRPPMV
jgi:hypothetical protein